MKKVAFWHIKLVMTRKWAEIANTVYQQSTDMTVTPGSLLTL